METIGEITGEKFLQQEAKKLSKAMKKAESKETMDPDTCTVPGCHGKEWPRSPGLCEFHGREKIMLLQAEEEKKATARQKEQVKIEKSPELQAERELNQRLQQHFQAFRWCDYCGHFCQHDEGWARVKKFNPASVGWVPGPQDRYFETVCAKCESKEY